MVVTTVRKRNSQKETKSTPRAQMPFEFVVFSFVYFLKVLLFWEIPLHAHCLSDILMMAGYDSPFCRWSIRAFVLDCCLVSGLTFVFSVTFPRKAIYFRTEKNTRWIVSENFGFLVANFSVFWSLHPKVRSADFCAAQLNYVTQFLSPFEGHDE